MSYRIYYMRIFIFLKNSGFYVRIFNMDKWIFRKVIKREEAVLSFLSFYVIAAVLSRFLIQILFFQFRLTRFLVVLGVV